MLERLARRAARGGFPLLVDEVYAEICPAGATTPAPTAARVLRVGSLSKIAGAPGLRAGWLLGDPDLLAELLPVHQYLVTAASRLAQAAIAGWCATGASELREVWAFYDQRRRLLSRRLAAVRGLRWREPEGGFFLFVDVRAAVGDATAELALELARRGEVVVVPGEAFGPGGAGFLRLSFAGAAGDIDEAAGRLARALERRRVA
jgi:aspartate/methionine/tyrosine aminotransferase